MYAFDYERPTTQADAVRLIQAGGRPLAGGQTLIASMKLHLASPSQLVDLGAIPELVGIRKQGDELVIGAMTCHRDVAESTVVREAIPALAALADLIGDKQIRSMGTIGGSVANNDPAADYPAALLALGATIHTASRKIAADDFFQGLFSTALEEGEIITAIHFPIPQRAAYVKFPQPASLFALIGVFVAQFRKSVRVAVTGGGSGVFRHTAMEAALSRDFSPAAIANVATDVESLSSDLHGSNAYRAHLVSVIAQRAVAGAQG
ncbi:MAG: xanthine dehydrogenase family protein subunit M [Nevskiaceae bacterium]|nr:MAG: xanthine dehydrogenase family protein subunit M [Nevskiaceae bacterium]TBR72801.1 MAG: xanthine dehydrogenase family protein subunit M [Nevskiaceae bacterium]